MRLIFTLIFILSSLNAVLAQEVIAPPKDSSTVIETKDVSVWPKPSSAAKWSIIPGGGQIYNKRYFKAPIVYAAMGTVVYFIDVNTKNYNRLQTAIIAELNGETHEFQGTSLTALRQGRDIADKNRQKSWIGLFALYLLQGVEAYVDAHLMHFDVEDDLGFEIKADMIPTAYGATNPGISIIIPISTK